MEQVTINPDNPRINLREHKELIDQVLRNEERLCANRASQDMIPDFRLEQIGW